MTYTEQQLRELLIKDGIKGLLGTAVDRYRNNNSEYTIDTTYRDDESQIELEIIEHLKQFDIVAPRAEDRSRIAFNIKGVELISMPISVCGTSILRVYNDVLDRLVIHTGMNSNFSNIEEQIILSTIEQARDNPINDRFIQSEEPGYYLRDIIREMQLQVFDYSEQVYTDENLNPFVKIPYGEYSIPFENAITTNYELLDTIAENFIKMYNKTFIMRFILRQCAKLLDKTVPIIVDSVHATPQEKEGQSYIPIRTAYYIKSKLVEGQNGQEVEDEIDAILGLLSSNYYINTLDNNANPKAFWRMIRSDCSFGIETLSDQNNKKLKSVVQGYKILGTEVKYAGKLYIVLNNRVLDLDTMEYTINLQTERVIRSKAELMRSVS